MVLMVTPLIVQYYVVDRRLHRSNREDEFGGASAMVLIVTPLIVQY